MIKYEKIILILPKQYKSFEWTHKQDISVYNTFICNLSIVRIDIYKDYNRKSCFGDWYLPQTLS